MTNEVSFVEYDPRTALPPVRRDPHDHGMLFLDCSDGGKVPKRSIHRLKQHAALVSRSAASKTSHSPEIAGRKADTGDRNVEDSVHRTREHRANPTIVKFQVAGPTWSTSLPSKQSHAQKSNRQNERSRKKVHGEAASFRWPTLMHHPRSAPAGTSVLGAFHSSYDHSVELSSVVQWFFYGNEEASRGNFDIAAAHWVRGSWRWALDNTLLFDSLVLNALKKRIDIAGNTNLNQRQYILQKGQLIQRVQIQVNNQGSDLDYPTIFMVATLAIVTFQDGDVQAARTHLEALKKIKATNRIPPYEWMGVWLIDLRLALMTGLKPVFEYYLPPNHWNVVPELNHQELEQRSADCCQLIPQSQAYSSRFQDVFRQLWQFYLAWPALSCLESEPFGMIYNLEFSLRTMHAELLHDTGDHEPSAAIRRSVELAIYAVQFHLWIAARFWEPLSYGTRVFAISKACGLLNSSVDLLDEWQHDANASPKALVWILSMLVALCIDEGDDIAPIPILDQALDAARITTKHDYIVELKLWPYLENWHGLRLPAVWDRIESYRESGYVAGQDAHRQPIVAQRGKSQRLFLGTVEFYQA